MSGTEYYYAVAAADSAGNLSPMSAAVEATAPVAPQAPGNLVATAISATQVGLAWFAPVSGGLPIQQYLIFRGTTPFNLTQVASTAATTYTDRSLAAGSTYYFAVEASDTGGDLSAMSQTASVTTPTVPMGPGN